MSSNSRKLKKITIIIIKNYKTITTINTSESSKYYRTILLSPTELYLIQALRGCGSQVMIAKDVQEMVYNANTIIHYLSKMFVFTLMNSLI